MGELKERAEAELLRQKTVAELGGKDARFALFCATQLIGDMAAEIERLSETVEGLRTMIQMQGRAIRDRYEPRE